MTLKRHVHEARERGIGHPGFEAPVLPSPDEPVESLIERRCADYKRRAAAEKARRLIPITIKTPGPIGIAHLGDPHVDDDGTNWPLLRSHVEICQQTEGLFAANVGDLSNNWVGRLARLYADQATTARQGWQLVEWLLRAVPWLYLVKGNHDLWSGAGDPVDWIMRGAPGVVDPYGARLALRFANGREVRVNARHDFRGHSQWNAAHGPAKAAQMGWRDHILTCGDKHVSGYNMLKDPASGLVSHAIRVGTYKMIDNYAKAGNFPDQNFSPCAVTIIDPEAEDEVDLVTVFWSLKRAASYLTWLRQERSA